MNWVVEGVEVAETAQKVSSLRRLNWLREDGCEVGEKTEQRAPRERLSKHLGKLGRRARQREEHAVAQQA